MSNFYKLITSYLLIIALSLPQIVYADEVITTAPEVVEADFEIETDDEIISAEAVSSAEVELLEDEVDFPEALSANSWSSNDSLHYFWFFSEDKAYTDDVVCFYEGTLVSYSNDVVVFSSSLSLEELQSSYPGGPVIYERTLIELNDPEPGEDEGELSSEKVEAVGASAESTLWWHKSLNTDAARANGYTGKGITVAVIDTGLDVDHKDLEDNIDDRSVCVTAGQPLEDGSGSGHGTHVSGIIAAEDNGYGITGIAPEARVVMVNAYNNTDGGFADSDIASAISYIVRECPDVSVVNMSLGGYTGEQEPALQAIIEYAISKNLLCIVAAGNEGAYNNRYGNGQTALPAGFEGVVSVASYNKNDELSKFSNYGERVDVVAPGEDILSTYLNNSYATFSGTSMATPMVTGIAALVCQKNNITERSKAGYDFLVDTLCNHLNDKIYEYDTHAVIGGIYIPNVLSVEPTHDDSTDDTVDMAPLTFDETWEYELSGSDITLNRFIGNQDEITVSANITIDGKTYNTKVGSYTKEGFNHKVGPWAFAPMTLHKIVFKEGVTFPEDVSYMFFGSPYLKTIDMRYTDFSNVTKGDFFLTGSDRLTYPTDGTGGYLKLPYGLRSDIKIPLGGWFSKSRLLHETITSKIPALTQATAKTTWFYKYYDTFANYLTDRGMYEPHVLIGDEEINLTYHIVEHPKNIKPFQEDNVWYTATVKIPKEKIGTSMSIFLNNRVSGNFINVGDVGVTTRKILKHGDGIIRGETTSASESAGVVDVFTPVGEGTALLTFINSCNAGHHSSTSYPAVCDYIYIYLQVGDVVMSEDEWALKLSMPSESIELKSTESTTIELSANQSYDAKQIYWASDDSSIAYVTKTGAIHGATPGTTKIYAYYGKYSSVKAAETAGAPMCSCNLIVTENQDNNDNNDNNDNQDLNPGGNDSPSDNTPTPEPEVVDNNNIGLTPRAKLDLRTALGYSRSLYRFKTSNKKVVRCTGAGRLTGGPREGSATISVYTRKTKELVTSFEVYNEKPAFPTYVKTGDTVSLNGVFKQFDAQFSKFWKRNSRDTSIDRETKTLTFKRAGNTNIGMLYTTKYGELKIRVTFKVTR